MLVLYKFEFVINDLHIIGFDFVIFYFSRHCEDYAKNETTHTHLRRLIRSSCSTFHSAYILFLYFIEGLFVWRMPFQENNNNKMICRKDVFFFHLSIRFLSFVQELCARRQYECPFYFQNNLISI